MKRRGRLYEKIYSKENIILADLKARKGKNNQKGVKLFDKDRDVKIEQLHLMLKNKTYKTSEYETFKIFEKKERIVSKLPYFPDRITHHAIMNVLEDIFVKSFVSNTFACVKGRGIKRAGDSVKKALIDETGTQFGLKLDIRKFYPSIDHDILKRLLRRKFKDKDLLWLLDEIIDSSEGVPIGNYLSQYFANFYLNYFDHWVKEELKVKYFFRYADDIVILASTKKELHEILSKIRLYFTEKLKLEIKSNYQIFPVHSRGIDFVGYKFYHKYTRLRKGIKKSLAKAVYNKRPKQSLASYIGWLKHCNGKNLRKKLLNERL